MKLTAKTATLQAVMQNQKGFLKIFLVLVAILAAMVLIGRHISSHDAALQTANVSADTVANSRKPAPTAAQVANQCADNPTGKTILVAISTQQMWACQGTALVNQSAVTTGASNAPNNIDDSTPVGTWHIYEKHHNVHLKGRDKNGPWDDYVQYWMPFDTEVGFHDASWQTFPFGSRQYKTSGSHGCVHLPTTTAAWLYDWAPVGTKVIVKA